MPKKYTFKPHKIHLQKYSDGTEVPHLQLDIMEWIEGGWVQVGYVENHLHRVKVDETDTEDISVGTTVRINPKNQH